MFSLRNNKGQVAFEFLIVYSFILIVFVVIFVLIASQRAAVLNIQQYSTLQLLSQNVASYIDQAVVAGSGYNASIPLATSLGTIPYNLTISSTGVVIASIKLGSQVLTAQAFSSARNLVVNGTKSPASNNAIQLYTLPITGTFKITNLNGVIYIDTSPAQVSALAQHISVDRISRALTPVFNGINSCASGTANFLNAAPAFTISDWVYLTSYSANAMTIYSEGNPSPAGSLYVSTSGTPCIQTFNQYLITQNIAFCSTSAIPLDTWTYLAASLNKNTAVFNITTNNLTQSGSGQEENAIGVNSIALGCNTGSSGGQNFNGLFGSETNLQIYNSTLSTPQIEALYQRGITSSPIVTNSLLAWYQLNGNTGDYSGNGNNATASNIVYQTTTQFKVATMNANGTAPTTGTTGQFGTLTGFVSGSGSLGMNGNYNASESICGSNQTAFLTSNSGKNINVTITGFNGNSTYLKGCGAVPTANSALVGWWPLDEGYGNTVHDISTNYNSLLFSGSYNGFPHWSAINQNATNFQTILFNGLSGQSITIPQSIIYNSIGKNGALTEVAWVYYYGPDAQAQTIFGDADQTNNIGFQLGVIGGTCTIKIIVGSMGATPPGSSCGGGTGLPIGHWAMVVGEFGGPGKNASIYLNGTLIVSQNIGAQQLNSTQPLSIGNDAWSGEADPFNGLITDVQLYSTPLNGSQISYLYKQGATGMPVQSGAALVGWWPVDGNSNDYSANQNNGAKSSNANFINVAFSNYTISNPSYSLSFNPASANAVQSSSAVDLFTGSKFTVVTWIKPMRKQINPTYDGVFRYGVHGPSAGCVGGTGAGDTLSLGIQGTGLPVISTYCNDFVPANGPIVNFNTWNFLAGEVNGTNAQLFLNGRWLNGTLPTLPNIQPGVIVIGSADPVAISGSMIFNGSIADVQVYNAVLTPQQLAQLYEQGFPLEARVNTTG